jgi:hypothetical protein
VVHGKPCLTELLPACIVANQHIYTKKKCVLQVLKYVSEARNSCLEREPLCREPAELQLLWKVVQLMCQHKGDLHSTLTPGVNDKRPGEICLSSFTA